MSQLAKKIAPKGVTMRARQSERGPVNQCWPLYGQGDLEDWEAVTSLHGSKDPETGQIRDWAAVQRVVDKTAGVTERIGLQEFRRHWRRRCGCWPRDLRL